MLAKLGFWGGRRTGMGQKRKGLTRSPRDTNKSFACLGCIYIAGFWAGVEMVLG